MADVDLTGEDESAAGEGAGRSRAIDRRQMLQRSAAVGAAVVWAVPAIELITSTAAAAASHSTTTPPPPADGCTPVNGLDYITKVQFIYSTVPPGTSGGTFYELDVETTVTPSGSTSFDATCTWTEVVPSAGQSVTIDGTTYSLSSWPSYWPASTFSDFQSRQSQVQHCSNYQQPVVVFQSGIGPVDYFHDNTNTNVVLYPVAVVVTGPVAGSSAQTTTLAAAVPSSLERTTVTGITVTLDPTAQTLSFKSQP